MSNNVFTLDALREETEKRYAPVKVGLSEGVEVTLTSLLRLGKKKRETVLKTLEDMKTLSDEDSDSDNLDTEEAELIVESISEIFGVIASDAKKLIAELDHDDPEIKVMLFTQVLNRWIEGGQLGEASTSPN